MENSSDVKQTRTMETMINYLLRESKILKIWTNSVGLQLYIVVTCTWTFFLIFFLATIFSYFGHRLWKNNGRKQEPVCKNCKVPIMSFYGKLVIPIMPFCHKLLYQLCTNYALLWQTTVPIMPFFESTNYALLWEY